ncbi:CHAT domain-containing tetratricopeptide repeat protein [Zavarzinella formosa]|uniref:CHAT domain-containing tetratricopeptide repeat protein n=1 Tax=Zavarzinella formosa TaxID=360055 RepID=UPI00030921E6|nr:CHAT domain-containing tetratricopeptide repeat protein [Zavarzinella formosa]
MFRYGLPLFCLVLMAGNGFGQANEIRTLLQDGRASLKAGKLDEAERQVKEAIALAEKHFTMDHPNGSDMYFELGEIETQRGNLRKAAEHYSATLTIRQKHLGNDHLSTANASDKLGITLARLRQYDKAEPLLLEALRAREKLVEANNAFLKISFDNLSEMYAGSGAYKKAEPFARRGAEFAGRVYGKDSKTLAISLNVLGQIQARQGNWKDARTTLEQSLEVAEIAYGKDGYAVDVPAGNLAAVHMATGRLAEAETLYNRALEIIERHKGKDDPATATALNNLAELYGRQGKLSKAETFASRALAINLKQPKRDNLAIAANYFRLGNIHFEAGSLNQAETDLNASLKLCNENLPPNHPQTAYVYNSLGQVYGALELNDKAEAAYRKALEIRLVVFGPRHSATAQSYANIGTICQNRGEYEKAGELYEKALDIIDVGEGKESLQTAVVLNNIYRLKIVTDKQARLDILDRAYQIHVKQLGPDHPETVRLRYNIGFGYFSALAYAKAEEPLRQSLRQLRATLGEAHPQMIIEEQLLGRTLYALGNRTEALPFMDASRRHTRTFVTSVLPGQSADDQKTFLKETDLYAQYLALTMGAANADEAKFAEASAAWLLNGKGSLQETQARTAQLANAGDSPAAKELRKIRAELADLSSKVRKVADLLTAARRAVLLDREKELAVTLQGAGSHLGQPLPYVELDAVRKELPKNAVFIDFARFERANLIPKVGEKLYGEACYVAWITPKTGPVRVVDLGSAKEIEELVAAARKELTGAPKLIPEVGNPDAEKKLLEALVPLAKRVLHPVLKEIGDAETLVISPDGSLWLLPWAAMPLPDGKYAIERFVIRNVVSGRDLVAVKEKITPSPAVIVANPDFDLDAKSAAEEAKLLLKEAPSRGLDSRRLALKIGRVPSLPGTAIEAREITPHVEKWLSGKPRVLTERQALKSVVTSFRNPEALILCTHGFFKPDQEAELRENLDPTQSRSAARTKDSKPLEDPLRRCGLLFAACNSADADGDDGILTGLEVVGCDLRGTKVVVLSACETGLGDVKNGEGVAGLRQAFQLAGAESVVATLWQVPDLESAQLMVGFFDNLSKGQARDEALRNSQIERIKERRTRYGAAHPYYWAAYAVTGQVK